MFDRFPVLKEPDLDRVPLHPLVPAEAWQVSALEDVQRTIVLELLWIDVSSAQMSTLTSPALLLLSSSTRTVTESEAEPLLLEQVIV